MRTDMRLCDGSAGVPRAGSKRRDERGVALLLTILGLLLLTAVAAAMLFSSNTETTIALNYRDKEAATYAAVSGVQEARDRIQPVYGDLALAGYVPTQLPGAAKGQIFYIINPRSGETVAPWDPTNAYFDAELCQEKNMAVLGVTVNSPGVLCGSSQIPSPHKCTLVGTAPSNWCSYYDNSANTGACPGAGCWKLKDAGGNLVPLDYKWVRITLKADNSGPVWVQTPGSAANGTQVCFESNPNQQIQKPAAAGTDCLGATVGTNVANVTLKTPGTGYWTAPAISFTGGGGSGATATASVSVIAGGINSTTLSGNGSGYTSSPTVTMVSPDGTGATFKALIKGSAVTALSVSSTNYCYQTTVSNLAVNFNPSPPPTAGGSATATVAMTGQSCVSGATAAASCGTSMKNKTLTLTLSGGFSGTINLDAKGKYSGPVTITNVGSYASVPASQNITASGCAVPVSFAGGIKVNSLNLTSGGEYVTLPTATIGGSTPSAPNATQPTVTVTWSAGATNGQLNSVAVQTPGSGYAQPNYTLAFSGGGGSGAAGKAVSGATATLSAINLTNGGSGYTAPPAVVIGGPGSGASATAVLAGGQQLLLGRVYMLTALASTQSGTQSIAQMETAISPPWKFQLGGALTLAGPNPNFGTPNSNIYKIDGHDAAGTGVEPAGCNNTPASPLPAIGVFDSAAQTSVISGLGKPKNYTGAQSAPDVYVTNAANPDPTQLSTLVSDIQAMPGTVNVTGPATLGSVSNWGSATSLETIVVNGDLTLSGNPSGYGVLVVTGNLVLNGDFSWHGLVLVLGTAIVNNQGGGNGSIVGSMYVATDTGSSLGSSTFNWNGGGGNGIQYDHCWADDLLNKYPPLQSDKALQVLSTRILSF